MRFNNAFVVDKLHEMSARFHDRQIEEVADLLQSYGGMQILVLNRNDNNFE